MSAAAADKLGRVLAIAGVLVAIATVAGAIKVMGTPAEQRRMRIDARRVEDLNTLVGAIREHAKEQGLPPDLATLAREPGSDLPLADPEGRGPYAYQRIDDRRFRVCAVFTTDTAKARSSEVYGIADMERWKHGAGRQCFLRGAKEQDDLAAKAE
jgi:hypothetical protein